MIADQNPFEENTHVNDPSQGNIGYSQEFYHYSECIDQNVENNKTSNPQQEHQQNYRRNDTSTSKTKNIMKKLNTHVAKPIASFSGKMFNKIKTIGK